MGVAPQAVKVDLTNSTGHIKRYTCADGTQISKGIILTLTDPRTASNPSGTAYGIPVGISSEEKEANDGATSIGVWTSGIFDLKASGAITAGDYVLVAGNNEVRSATLALDGAPATTSYALFTRANKLGVALETAADAEVINVLVNIGM